MAEFQFFEGVNETVPATPMEIIAPTTPLGPVPTIPRAPEEVQEAKPRETNQLQQGPTAQENDLRVYFRKNKIQEEKGPNTSQMQSNESNQAPENEIPPINQIPNSEPVHTSIAELDIPISLR
ncbi:putative papain-like cysteine prorease [Sesbania bispinosa]|nr:putative papain-like cysteine prorease [Sesbania bispinosa]